jgi:hypothetical protein
MPGFLLADIDVGDLVQIAVFVVVVAVGFFNWLAARLRQAGQQPPGNPPPAARRPPPAAQQAEIEEFLRRAAQGRGGPPAQPPQPARPQAAPPRPQPPAQRPPLVQRPQPPAARPQGSPFAAPRPAPSPRTPSPPIEAVEVPPAERRPLGSGVAQHVRQHLDAGEFEARAAQLTSVDQADEQMDEHIHQALDRQVGSLGEASADMAGAGVATSAAPSAAAAIRRMLSQPEGMRQAVILAEILGRRGSRE